MGNGESVKGTGFTAEVKGSKLVIEVDLKHDGGISGSGKSQVIATSKGNVDIGGGVMLGLNVYTKLKK